MRKVVILLFLGMVLVGMTPTAMSEGNYVVTNNYGEGQYDDQGRVGPDNEDAPYEVQAQNWNDDDPDDSLEKPETIDIAMLDPEDPGESNPGPGEYKPEGHEYGNEQNEDPAPGTYGPEDNSGEHHEEAQNGEQPDQDESQ